MSRTIELGGRTFESFTVGTLEHDLFVMDRARAAGLTEMKRAASESPEQYADRLLAAILASPAVYELMASWIVPVGKTATDWTPDLARDTAAHIRKLTGERDKAAARSMVLELVIEYFLRGTDYTNDSGRSFAESSPQGDASEMRTPIDTANGAV